LLQETTDLFNVKVAAYCLMPTHYHLLLQTPDAKSGRTYKRFIGSSIFNN
jgi:REP element-mobilizing transposase RayT